jgi:hypothetical protein
VEPDAAANWSLLFSRPSGLAAHEELAALGESEKAEGSRRWIIISLVCSSAVARLRADAGFEGVDAASRTVALRAAVCVVLLDRREHRRPTSSSAIGKDYPRKGGPAAVVGVRRVDRILPSPSSWSRSSSAWRCRHRGHACR